MAKPEKIAAVERLQAEVAAASALYFLDFTKVRANEMNEVRRRLRQQRIGMRVVKNRLALRALVKSGVPEEVERLLRGPTSLVLATEDPIAPARLLKETTARLKELRFKGAYFERRVFGPEEFDFLASLPTKEEIRAQAVGILAGSLQELAGVLDGLLGEMVFCIEHAKKSEA